MTVPIALTIVNVLFVMQFIGLLYFLYQLGKQRELANLEERKHLIKLTSDMVTEIRTSSASEAENLRHMRKLNDLEAMSLEDTWKSKLSGDKPKGAGKDEASGNKPGTITTPDGRELEPIDIREIL